MSDISKKWNKRYQSASDSFPEACRVLQDNAHLLPANGNALDLACGLGGNALLMADLNLTVQAWDISEEAITRLNTQASSRQLLIHTETRDIVANPPRSDAFDVIVISYFLHRPLAKLLYTALKPDGLLFYQTFTRRKAPGTESLNRGPGNPDFLLADNELLELFSDLRLLAYREEGLSGDIKLGLRNEALFVGQKVKNEE